MRLARRMAMCDAMAHMVEDKMLNDSDLTFVLNGYRDVPRGAWAVGCLREHYPRSRVLVIVDGDPDWCAWEPLRAQAEVRHTERLYGPITRGGALWEARLRACTWKWPKCRNRPCAATPVA